MTSVMSSTVSGHLYAICKEQDCVPGTLWHQDLNFLQYPHAIKYSFDFFVNI